MKCECGNDRFYASQNACVKVIIDSNGDFVDYRNETIEKSISDWEQPCGELICTKCSKVFKTID